MDPGHLLAAVGRRLNAQAGAPDLPSFYFLTDPARTPDPIAIAKHLPRGSAVIYRHFGAADRNRIAARLSAACRSGGLKLLIAADPELAGRIGADGVHWPEKRLPGENVWRGLVTAAAHSAEAVARAAAFGAHACFLSPVFETRSHNAGAPLGLFRASQIARTAALPVIGLGGISVTTARKLSGRGFAGLGAIDALLDA